MESNMVDREQDRRAWVLAAIDEFEGPLLRYAGRLAQGQLDAARDAVQHTFLRLCDQQPETLDGRLAPWLFTVCRNRLVDLQRQSARLKPLPAVEGVGRETDPAERFETHDEGEQLRRIVATLPAKQQEVVNLWAEGFSYGEISEITGHTAGHTRVLVHRAFQTIRQHPTIRRQLMNEASTAPSGKTPVGN